MLDATCVPADITYPTDMGLLNEAREKLEGIIDLMHPHTGKKRKPRTYRKRARREYLAFVKRRKKGKRVIRKAIRKQLGYVRRNLSHIDKMLVNGSAFVDKIGWDNYSEAELLPDAVERYRWRYGYYPEASVCPAHVWDDRQRTLSPILMNAVTTPCVTGWKVNSVRAKPQ